MEKHAEYIAAYGNKKDDYVRLYMKSIFDEHANHSQFSHIVQANEETWN